MAQGERGDKVTTKPEEIRFGARFCTSKYEQLDNPERWNQVAEEYLRIELAHYLQKYRSETIITDNSAEKRLEIYAASPDLFWKIVRKEAEKIALRYMRNT